MQMQSVFRRYESNVQCYARQFPCVFDRALGAELFDVDGHRYLDFFAGAGALNYGHNNPLIKQALIDYLEQDSITHSLDLHTCAKANFLETFQNHILAPRGLDYVMQFTGPTGANAVEAALKLARKVTGRTNVLSFTNGFHGVSAGALSVTGNKYHRRAAGIPLSGASVVPFDGYLGADVDTLDYIEAVIDDPSSGVDDPAAVIIEGVQGEGGLNVASAPWLRRLSEICRRRNIMLILDEIQTGCGRTGDFFSFEEAGVVPDLVTLSKSLSGYGLPLAVLLIRRDIDAWKPGEHNGTFRGNNLAFVSAAAAIDHYWRDPSFAAAVRRKGALLHDRLKALREAYADQMIEVRGRGMMQGIRCADPEAAAAISGRAFRHGLLIERAGPHDEVLKCLMPLTITDAELNEGLDILADAAASVLGRYRASPPPARLVAQPHAA